MSGMGDKLKGKVNEATGNAKQEIGKRTDDETMVAEGKADEAKGEAQGVLGKVKDAAQDLKDKVKKD